MICSRCGAADFAAADVCPSCGEAPELAGRFRLESVVGRGAFGCTYRAVRITDGVVVAVKEHPYRAIDTLKTLELFAREARVLRALEHPRIPRYLDDFEAGEGRQRAFYLVQEFVDGVTLQEEMGTRRHTAEEVFAIVTELLTITEYLHALSPPVIHRDIKAGNVMRRRSDDALVLIDFGAVQDHRRDSIVGGSTVAGTYGYMAPEQFSGRAMPSSDLYSIGVLAIVMLTRERPERLLDEQHRLVWQNRVRIDPEKAEILSWMTEPVLEKRAKSASQVQARLLGAQAKPPALAHQPKSCPSCEGDLTSVELEGGPAMRCGHCRGFVLTPKFFNVLEHSPALLEAARKLDDAQGARPADEKRPNRVRYLRCTVCGQQMARARFMKICQAIVNRCPPHGVFVAAGDLRVIADFLARGGRVQSELSQAAEALEDQAQQLRAERSALGIWRPKGRWR